MKHLCAICARREADTLQFLDGKRRPVCLPCVNDPVRPVDPIVPVVIRDKSDGVSPKLRLIRLVTNSPGSSFREIREALDIAGPGSKNNRRRRGPAQADRYTTALKRLVASGLVERRGDWPDYTYWPARRVA